MTGSEPPTVAIVLDDKGVYVDRCWNWETGQNYALGEGRRVIAVADDGAMTVAEAQALYDAERERYIDCFYKPAHPDHRYNPAPFCAKCGGPCEMPYEQTGVQS